MQKKYQEALKNLKKPSDSSYKAFSTEWDYQDIQVLSPGKNSPPPENIAAVKPVEDIPRKEEVLESFAGFAKEQLDTSPSISFSGGEVKTKDGDYKFSVLTTSHGELLDYATQLLNKDLVDIHYRDKETDKIKVFFVSDCFMDESFTALDQPNEYTCCFEESVSELFSKMVGAMKLTSPETLITALSDESGEKDFSELVMKEISHFQPQFIVSLGAQATNFFIGADKKLRNHHGQLFQLKFNSGNDILFEAALMPLFSPKLLNIAPNMKKTAWEDMQKLMQKL